MTRFLKKCLPLVLTPLLIAAAPGPEESEDQSEPNPAVWLISDDDTQIYMIGTNHILPPGYVWRSAALDAIIGEVDELVMETADENIAAKVAQFQDRLLLDTPVPILDRVSPERRMDLRGFLKHSGLPAEALDQLETWAAALTLSMLPIFNGDYGEEQTFGDLSGAEDELAEIFTDDGRPISGLETAEQQIGFLASISPEGQTEMLDAVVEQLAALEESPGDFEEDVMLESWRAGDVATLDQECDSEESFTAEVQELLLESRNARWLEWVRGRLDSPGSVLLAVGACHLAGSVSLQIMLRGAGYEVTRIH